MEIVFFKNIRKFQCFGLLQLVWSFEHDQIFEKWQMFKTHVWLINRGILAVLSGLLNSCVSTWIFLWEKVDPSDGPLDKPPPGITPSAKRSWIWSWTVSASSQIIAPVFRRGIRGGR